MFNFNPSLNIKLSKDSVDIYLVKGFRFGKDDEGKTS